MLVVTRGVGDRGVILGIDLECLDLDLVAGEVQVSGYDYVGESEGVEVGRVGGLMGQAGGRCFAGRGWALGYEEAEVSFVLPFRPKSRWENVGASGVGSDELSREPEGGVGVKTWWVSGLNGTVLIELCNKG